MKAILCKSYGPPENLVLEEVQDFNPKVVCPIPAAQWFMLDSRWGLGYV